MRENDEFVRTLNRSKNPDDAVQAVAAYVKNLRKEGHTGEAILARMEELLSLVGEEQGNVLRDVMDFLTGWCSPHMKID